MKPTAETTAAPSAMVKEEPTTVPIRQLVRMYPRYPDAADAVDRLRRAGISGERVTIVGEDLHWVREGDPARAAARTTWAAGILGTLIGLLFWAVGLHDPDVGVFIMGGFGAIVGALAGIAGLAGWYYLTRDDTSVPESGRVEAQRFDLLVDEAHCERAAEVLEETA